MSPALPGREIDNGACFHFSLSFRNAISNALPPKLVDWIWKGKTRFTDTAPLSMELLFGCASSYQRLYPGWVRLIYILSYVFLQSFAIPGSSLLSVLAGALFDFWTAQLYICVGSTLGSTICYGLSYKLGTSIFSAYLEEPNNGEPKRDLDNSWFVMGLRNMRSRVELNGQNLIWYMLFLRITPLVPNWFVNVSCPIVGVPLRTYMLGTFFGIMPGNVIHIVSGQALKEMTAPATFTGKQSFALLFVLQFIALAPVLAKKHIQNLEKKWFATKAD
eukprot:g3288.t1